MAIAATPRGHGAERRLRGRSEPQQPDGMNRALGQVVHAVVVAVPDEERPEVTSRVSFFRMRPYSSSVFDSVHSADLRRQQGGPM
jgi:hypothetical protein